MDKDVKGILFSLLFILFGALMIAFPDTMEGADVSGRRTLIKRILVGIWSMPAGILFLFLGGFGIYRTIASSSSSKKS